MEEVIELTKKHPKLFIDILEAMKDAVYISDSDGKTVWINSVSESMCRLPREEIIGKNVSVLEKEGVFSPSVTRLALEAKKNVTTVQTLNNGRKYISTGHLIKDNKGKIIVAVAHCRDITETIKNTTQLRETEELLERYKEEIKKLSKENLKKESSIPLDIAIKSQSRLKTQKIIEKIASVDTTALIIGETGTGKSVTANEIHLLSKRKHNPFIQVNCASIPETLLESELFGYEKGSFTGASSHGKAGLIQVAEQGTIFLDEVGELPLHLQTKILHFLQTKEYMPIGAREYKQANVRIIAATNRDLEKMVNDGLFRSDLFYRMNVLTVRMPPLRECVEDIREIALYILEKLNREYNMNKAFSDKVIKAFENYAWPGNLRELEHLIERLIILSENEIIDEKDLPHKMIGQSINPSHLVDQLSGNSMPDVLEEIEKNMIQAALETEGSTRKAAKQLGVSQSMIMRRIVKYGIKIEADSCPEEHLS